MESTRVDGTTFSPTEQTYSQIQDRRTFVEWELERWRDDLAAVLADALSENRDGAGCLPDDLDVAGAMADAAIKWTLTGPELIQWKEVGDVCNAFVRGLLDDEAELPPGMGARPKNYISQRGGTE